MRGADGENLSIVKSARLKTVRTYPTRIEADIAKLALDAADIPSVVIGVGTVMEGGIAGVKLQVPEDQVGRALQILEDA